MSDLSHYLILVTTGLVAGVINTLAGGGSNLTLPALMLLGMPADVANATNRVGVFLQCAVGVRGFRKAGRLPQEDLPGILGLTMAGGLAGAVMASVLPNLYLKPLMLGMIVCMTLVMLVRPALIVPPPGTPPRPIRQSHGSWPALFLAGFYGGFVQAGVGFMLLAAFAGALRYDLVRANALKLLCTLMFTGVALLVFAMADQVLWLPGLVLALGTMIGAQIGVGLAIKISPVAMKWTLLGMTLAACGAAWVS